METRNCSSVLLLKQDCCSRSTTQGTNVNEILWTSSSAAETAVINSQGYFQPTLVRFTQPGSGVIWAEPLCWIWLQECTTNIQRDEPVNYSLLYPALPPSSRNLSAHLVYLRLMSTQLLIRHLSSCIQMWNSFVISVTHQVISTMLLIPEASLVTLGHSALSDDEDASIHTGWHDPQTEFKKEQIR